MSDVVIWRKEGHIHVGHVPFVELEKLLYRLLPLTLLVRTTNTQRDKLLVKAQKQHMYKKKLHNTFGMTFNDTKIRTSTPKKHYAPF